MLLGNIATVGIDLGTTGMRAVEVAWRGNRPVVEKWAAVDFEQDVIDWAAADASKLSHLIHTTLEKNGLRNTWAAHAVCGESVAPQYFSFPKLLPEDVPDAVRIEVEAGLPFRVENALVSFALFPDRHAAAVATPEPENEPQPEPEAETTGGVKVTGLQGNTHGLALAADNTFVEARLRILTKAKLDTFCVEADGTACGNAFLATNKLDAIDGTTAILNIGHCYSNLTLLNDGTILIRDIPFGGKRITGAIAEMLHLDDDEAERIKHTHWEKGPEESGVLGGRMNDVLNTVLLDLTDRLRDSVQYWVGERLVPGLGRLLLTGGGSQVRELPEKLSDALGVPVERWSPVADASNKKDERREPWEARLSVAFGLALRSFPRKSA